MSTNQSLQSNFSIQARNKKQLAEEMGLSLRTFQRRLKEADIQIPRGLIAPRQQLEIYHKLGWHEMA
ncbi:MAG TPA: hypothetical protein PLO67_13505 [Saprospiraceae bacterium]|jgi:predicted DNA-binding protein (UPF0251 family)|nr:hypothetical protein [Saprospiraceae bacterium]HPI07071.1 hypothetical protein [Saprospiraceae bacterium]